MVVIKPPLLVIGAALSRTGTLSTKAALELLGHKVLHGTNMLQAPWPNLWRDVAVAEKSKNDTAYDLAIGAMVQSMSDLGYTAVLDLPMAVIYQELMERNPDAKVLLTVRDRDSWARSIVSTAFRLPPLFRQVPFIWLPRVQNILQTRELVWPKLRVPLEENHKYGIKFNGTNDYEVGSIMSLDYAKVFYDNYVAEVRAVVPPDRLVEFDVRDGWGPLCDRIGFRDDEVGSIENNANRVCPSEKGVPFPKLNAMSSGLVQRIILIVKIISWTWPFLIAGSLYFIASIVRLAARLCRKSHAALQRPPKEREHKD